MDRKNEHREWITGCINVNSVFLYVDYIYIHTDDVVSLEMCMPVCKYMSHMYTHRPSSFQRGPGVTPLAMSSHIPPLYFIL